MFPKVESDALVTCPKLMVWYVSQSWWFGLFPKVDALVSFLELVIRSLELELDLELDLERKLELEQTVDMLPKVDGLVSCP